MSKKRTTKKPKPCYVWVPMDENGVLYPTMAETTRKELRRCLKHANFGVCAFMSLVRCEVRPVKKGKR